MDKYGIRVHSGDRRILRKAFSVEPAPEIYTDLNHQTEGGSCG